MTSPQLLIFFILAVMMGLFLWGRFRHDVVALAALMVCVVAGVVPADAAFAGFSHPAVTTVACVLVLSQGLRNTGAVDWLARSILPRDGGRLMTMATLMGLGAALSGFMNDLPPGRPSFITRVWLVDSRRFRVGQARRVRCRQIAQAPGALRRVSDCPAKNAA
jgi:hypothetical protein